MQLTNDHSIKNKREHIFLIVPSGVSKRFSISYIPYLSYLLMPVYIFSWYFNILQKHCSGVNLIHQWTQTLEQSVYVIQWNRLFMAFLINPEKYRSKMKLPHCLLHQIQEPAKDMTHIANHQLRDLNAKLAADHIVGNPLYTITYDSNVERSPIFSAHIVLIEQNLLGISRNTSNQSICQGMNFISNLYCFQYRKSRHCS